MKHDRLLPRKRARSVLTTRGEDVSSNIENSSFAVFFIFMAIYCLFPTMVSFQTPTEAFVRPYPRLSGKTRSLVEISTMKQQQRRTTLPTASSSLVMLFMGKGDGRKKRKKKSSTLHTNSGTTSVSNNNNNAAAVPRVSNDINIPVRRQIQWANLNKEYRRQQQAATTGGSFNPKKVERTKFRKLVNETELNELLEYRKNNRDPNWDELLNANNTKAPPLLLVDAYNIINKWDRLEKHLKTGNLAHARQLLIADLEDLHSWKQWDIECVFDGGRRDPALGTRTTSSASQCGIQIVFTGIGMETADSYVEQTCRHVAETGTMVIVATDDSMIRLAVQTNSNSNAYHMSADRLIEELKVARQVISHQVEAVTAKFNGHGIRPKALRTRETAHLLFNVGAIVVEDKRQKGNKAKMFTDIKTAYRAAINDEMDANGKRLS